jgi:hypothetical protein
MRVASTVVMLCVVAVCPFSAPASAQDGAIHGAAAIKHIPGALIVVDAVGKTVGPLLSPGGPQTGSHALVGLRPDGRLVSVQVSEAGFIGSAPSQALSFVSSDCTGAAHLQTTDGFLVPAVVRRYEADAWAPTLTYPAEAGELTFTSFRGDSGDPGGTGLCQLYETPQTFRAARLAPLDVSDFTAPFAVK